MTRVHFIVPNFIWVIINWIWLFNFFEFFCTVFICIIHTFVSDYVSNVLVSYKNEKNMSNLHFLYDQAPCHMTKRVNETFAAARVRSKNVPKRMTPFLQPADVSWMSPIKSKYFLRWNRWLINAPKSYTAAGNMRSRGYAMVT